MSGTINNIRVIARAAAILRVVEKHPSGSTVSEIAEQVRLPRSTVQRIVAALVDEGLLISLVTGDRFQVGPLLLRLAGHLGKDFVAVARPLLTQLSRDLAETVDLAALRGDHLVFIDQVVGPQRLRAVSAVGESFPLHCTANGKAILAKLEMAEVNRLLEAGLPARTENAKTNETLLVELEEVRETGVAWDIGEHTLGICATGVALQDSLGKYLAISVPVPSVRFYDNRMRIADRLVAMRDILERVARQEGAVAEL